MALKDEIFDAVKTAMKNRDTERLSTLRMLQAALKQEEVDTRKDLEDSDVERIVIKQVKQLKDAQAEFEKGGREDLKEKAQAEMDILSVFLPKQMADDELITIVEATITELGGKDAVNMGQVMGTVMKKVGTAADGSRVRTLVTKSLES